ncbi:uncharacterized protein LJ206_011142 [Theristicus caerulescens]
MNRTPKGGSSTVKVTQRSLKKQWRTPSHLTPEATCLQQQRQKSTQPARGEASLMVKTEYEEEEGNHPCFKGHTLSPPTSAFPNDAEQLPRSLSNILPEFSVATQELNGSAARIKEIPTIQVFLLIACSKLSVRKKAASQEPRRLCQESTPFTSLGTEAKAKWSPG